jgi:alkylation response protein AidB-like acyl-CoA dehydrogenase
MSLRVASRRLLAAKQSLFKSAACAYTTHSQLPEEHKMVYDMCRKFADEELAPNAGEWDKKHQFPKQAIEQLVRLTRL